MLVMKYAMDSENQNHESWLKHFLKVLQMKCKNQN